MTQFLTLLLALTLLATPGLGDANPPPPAGTTSTPAAGDVLIAWMPAVSAPGSTVYYRVYAKAQAEVDVTETEWPYAFVDAGYEYEISAVIDGEEGARFAACVRIDLSDSEDPVSIEERCGFRTLPDGQGL